MLQIKDRKKLVPMFKVQIDKVKGSMKQKSTQRERPVKPVYIPPANIDLSPEEMAEAKATAEAAGVSLPPHELAVFALALRRWCCAGSRGRRAG